MLSGPWSRCIQLDQTGKGFGETARTRPVPRSLRCDVENIFDQEVIGDAGLKGIKLLVTRSTQLVHSLQSPQDINVRHALLFRVITRFYVSPSKNRDDVVSFLLVFIPCICRPRRCPTNSTRCACRLLGSGLQKKQWAANCNQRESLAGIAGLRNRLPSYPEADWKSSPRERVCGHKDLSLRQASQSRANLRNIP